MPRTSSRRTLVAAAIAVVLLLALVAVLWPSMQGDTSTPSPSLNPKRPPVAGAEGERPADAPPAATAAPSAAIAATASPTPADLGELLGAPKLASLAVEAADEYRRRARYPRSSQPIAEGEDPILRDRQVSPVTAAGEGGAPPVLTVFPEQVSFEDPAPVRLYAFLADGNQRVPALAIEAELQSEALVPLAPVFFRDDGGGGDGRAGDALYSAFFELDEELRTALSATYLVRVRAVTLEGEERATATGFLYSSPHARLTGSYRDRLDAGDLLIEAEIQVASAGRFHLEGSLYGGEGRPLAWAQSALEVGPGRHWMELRYFGLVLREAGIDGPYVLRYAALSTTTQMPNAKNDVVENAHTTAAYEVEGFSDAPFDDPDLLDAADRLEGEGGE